MNKAKDPAAVTAERIAALIEAPETPPVVRELLQHLCFSIDVNAAERIAGTEDFKWAFPGAELGYFVAEHVTPARIRRHLPKLLRKVARWRVGGGLTDINPPDEKGGA